MNYSEVAGYCDNCGPEHWREGKAPVTYKPELWKWPLAVLDCPSCEISLCQKCHDEQHKRNCQTPPEMYSTKYYFYPEWLPK